MILIILFAQLFFNPPETKFLALGDSYTIGESVAEAERWPNQLAAKLKLAAPHIIATTGWRTDNLKDAIEAFEVYSKFVYSAI